MSNQNLDKVKVKSEQLSIVTAKDLNLKEAEKVSHVSFAISIRALLQNWRQGTVGCKTRSDVAYSNKKPWKQKGTGRARAGSRRSPLWVGGGIIFGPQPRVRKLKVNRGLRRNLLNNIVWNLLENKKLLSLDYTVSEKPKTAEVYKLLKNLNLHDKKVVFLIDPSDFLTYAAFANISNIKLLLFDELNSYDLTSGETLIFLKKDLNFFKEMVSRWI